MRPLSILQGMWCFHSHRHLDLTDLYLLLQRSQAVHRLHRVTVAIKVQRVEELDVDDMLGNRAFTEPRALTPNTRLISRPLELM